METALPNLHPALVHFPLVLVPIAFIVDVVAQARRARPLRRLGALTWLLAAMATTATFFAGRSAADGLRHVPAMAQPAIGQHADWATSALVLCVAVALVRATLEWSNEGRWTPVGRGVAMLSAVALTGILLVTADKGGALVYRHGLGVDLPECVECPEGPSLAPEPEVVELESPILERSGASWVWHPARQDASALSAEPWPSRGAAYVLSGSHVLTFEPVLGDVQLAVQVDLSRFDGQLELQHHVGAAGHGALIVDSQGGFRLVDGGTDLDRGSATLGGVQEIVVNASGSHLKGMVDGATVVHGHAPARSPGRVALVFDGQGVVILEQLEIVPLEGH